LPACWVYAFIRCRQPASLNRSPSPLLTTTADHSKFKEPRRQFALQRLIYLGVLLFITPLIWNSGWLYLSMAIGRREASPAPTRMGHDGPRHRHLPDAGLFRFASVSGHADHPVTEHIEAMIAGWKEP